jgi:hypothetical protein
MKHQQFFTTALAALTLTLCTPTHAGDDVASGRTSTDGARYMVTFRSTWTEKTHPFEYPEAGLLSGPHFSGLIGTTHGEGFALYKEGMIPTRGLERLSEEGKHSPLDEEINAAIESGKAGVLFETGPIRDAAKAQMVEIAVDEKFPLVSAVAMIAPSPDWFAGAANISLMQDGNWVPTRTVELYAWDAGSDDGSTYEASDLDANPKKKTTKAMTRHFVVDGAARPVATLVFTLVKETMKAKSQM